MTPRYWPNFCHDPSSCDRHMRCMYLGCRWEGYDIETQVKMAVDRAEIERANKPARTRHPVSTPKEIPDAS